jgi:hypothetical protein
VFSRGQISAYYQVPDENVNKAVLLCKGSSHRSGNTPGCRMRLGEFVPGCHCLRQHRGRNLLCKAGPGGHG